MHKIKPHLRVMMEKEQLDAYARLRSVGPHMTITPVTDKIPDKKRVRLLEDRYTQIEKDNRLLLEKIMNIMNNTRPQTYKQKAISVRGRNANIEIARENQILLQKITSRKSQYSKSVMDKFWTQNQSYAFNLTGQRPSTQKNRYQSYSFAL